MKTKVYLNDWFLNCGIIGFLRILEDNKDKFAEINENYISFDTEKLKNFHKYYFKYFFDKYNVGERVVNRLAKSFENLEKYLNIETDNKQEQKEIKDKIKAEKKYIKNTMKSQLDKIKKYNVEIYEEMLEEYNKIDSVKEKEDIGKLNNIKDVFSSNIKKDIINKRLTANLFKSILSNNYFGQMSFLNVVNNTRTYEEQEELMYRDYICNIVEINFLNEIIQDKYALEDIKNKIEEKLNDKLMSKQMLKIYGNIQKKYIKKEKDLNSLKEYIEKEVFSYCYMCENEKSITSNYSEGKFIPLALSSNDAKNFFWNQNVSFPICDVCKLILFCIPAGISIISKTIQENVNGQVVYRDKEINSFVNYDVSIEELRKTNDYLTQSSKNDKTTSNPYADLILNIVEQEKNLSNWQLQNIFVVEFETEYLSFSRIEYFNIKRYIAEFFTEYAKNSLVLIKDYRYKIQIMDYIMKNKDIKYVINNRLREELNKEFRNGFNCFLATKTRLDLNLLKKEDINMKENIKKNNDKLYVLYNLGISIHEELKAKKETNKIDGYIYRMLNSIKAGNKKDFMDIVIRIHMSMGKDVSPIFLEVLQDTDLDFESIGHSFVSGLISDKFEKKD